MKNLSLAFILLISLFTSGQGLSPSQQHFYQQISARFSRIDTIREFGADRIIQDPDLQQRESTALDSFLQSQSTLIFTLPDTLNFDLLYISRSADSNLCLVSWDTRMGGTMIDFRTLALYRTKNGIYTQPLSDEGDNTKFHYDTIFTIQGKDKSKIYLAYGFGQGSMILPWQDLRAFSINGNELIMPTVFPAQSNRLFVEFDLNEFDEGSSVPNIKFQKGGYHILVPETAGNGGFSGKFFSLIFNGTRYR